MPTLTDILDPSGRPITDISTGLARSLIVDASGGGYANVNTALAAITDASETKRYGVVVLPGRYDLGSSPIILKPGVDIRALVPGTVEFYSSTPTTELLRVYINQAAAFRIKVQGLNFRGVTGNPYVLDEIIGPDAGVLGTSALIEIEDCELTSASATTSAYVVHTTAEVNGYNANSRLRFTRSLIRHTGAGLHAVHVEDYLLLFLDHCRIGIGSAAGGSSPVLDAGALKIYLRYCTLIGGANSISGSGSIVMTHCALQRALTGVINGVATNNFVATNAAIDDF